MQFLKQATALGAVLMVSAALVGAAVAEPDVSGEVKKLPHAIPLPPPDSLRPDAVLPDAVLDDVQGQKIPQDKPVVIGGVTVLCTGTGSSKETLDWQSYPVRVAFSNAAAQYLSGMHVRLSENGASVADFVCWAPWVLFKAPEGRSFKLVASLAGRADSPLKSASFVVPASGQKRVNIAFPEVQANE